MQPFKRFRFVHNNKKLNYSAIPELNDFFIKRGVGTVDISGNEALDCPQQRYKQQPTLFTIIYLQIQYTRRLYITSKKA